MPHGRHHGLQHHPFRRVYREHVSHQLPSIALADSFYTMNADAGQEAEHSARRPALLDP